MGLRTRRGFTFADVIAGALIMAIAMVGMVNLAALLYSMTSRNIDTSVSYQLARASMEQVKDLGFPYAPEGTTTTYYDSQGLNGVTTATSSSTYSVTVSIVSDKVETRSDGTTGPAPDALRSVTVTVLKYPSNTTLTTWTTLLVRGGI